jgi:hypothetical protein
LARSTTSSKLLKVTIGAIGPNGSSRHQLGVVRQIGHHGGLEEDSPGCRAACRR